MTKKKKKVKKKEKKKRKKSRSAKQIAAARRNIKKARAALHHTHKRKYARAAKATRGQKRKLRKQNPMARRRRKRSRRSYRRSRSRSVGAGKLFSTRNLALATGAGFAGAAGAVVNKFAPNIIGNTAQAIAGGALYYLGKGFIKTAGLGVLIKTAGDLIEDQVAPKVIGAIGGSSGW